jgi:hypothetical protein
LWSAGDAAPSCFTRSRASSTSSLSSCAGAD